jgi:hypothetical protein
VHVATDVGGTFTDFVVLEEGRMRSYKVPSTPISPDAAVADGLSGLDGHDIETFAHGTTVATNTVLQRSGARVALVTTAGFEDILEIGRQTRPSVYDLRIAQEPPLTPRGLRFGVRERVLHDGSVLEPLVTEEAERVADLVATSEAEAAAVCLLYSYLRPEHEKMVGEALEARGGRNMRRWSVRPWRPGVSRPRCPRGSVPSSARWNEGQRHPWTPMSGPWSGPTWSAWVRPSPIEDLTATWSWVPTVECCLTGWPLPSLPVCSSRDPLEV